PVTRQAPAARIARGPAPPPCAGVRCAYRRSKAGAGRPGRSPAWRDVLPTTGRAHAGRHAPPRRGKASTADPLAGWASPPLTASAAGSVSANPSSPGARGGVLETGRQARPPGPPATVRRRPGDAAPP